MFPRLLRPDGSGATLAASSGAMSSTNTVLTFGPVSWFWELAADPMRRIWTAPGGLILE